MVMPITGTPRVIIHERETDSPITGSDSVSAALFIGQTVAGPGFQVTDWDRDNPQRPVRVVSWDEYVRKFGKQLPGGNRFQADVRDAYVSHAVRGFFDNGGKDAWILRLTTEVNALWDISSSVAPTPKIFQVVAAGGEDANRMRLELKLETRTAIAVRVPDAVAIAAANVADSSKIELADIGNYAAGDTVDVIKDDNTLRGAVKILAIDTPNKIVTVHPSLLVDTTDTMRLASQKKQLPGAPLATFRLPLRSSADAVNLMPGTLIEIAQAAAPANVLWAVVARVDVTAILITQVTADLDFYDVGVARTLTVKPHSFAVTLTDSAPPDPAQALADIELKDVSPIATSPRFLGTLLADAYTDKNKQLLVPVSVKVINEDAPLELLLPTPIAVKAPDVDGKNDAIGGLAIGNYQDAIGTLDDFEDAKLIVAPDTAGRASDVFIQQALREHCEARADRFVLLDAPKDMHARDKLKSHVDQLRSDKGFAAFYYPWIKIAAPREYRETFMFVPPSGHIAGMVARVDAQDGVHKSPANEKLRGALDVEKRLGDVTQNPLHDEGINVLRVFHGDAAVNVFGGRTTAPKDKMNFRYIAVRRLFLFVEDALKRSLRGTIYEPNEPGLWKALTRNISEFLFRVQSSGALFASDDSRGFYVRIDEGNNPESQRAAGILTIEIGLRPSYPAEYILVDIGIWDGQVTIAEG